MPNQPDKPHEEYTTRLDGEPVDVTLDDGRVVTIAAEPNDGRLKVKVLTPGPARLKRRKAEKPAEESPRCECCGERNPKVRWRPAYRMMMCQECPKRFPRP